MKGKGECVQEVGRHQTPPLAQRDQVGVECPGQLDPREVEPLKGEHQDTGESDAATQPAGVGAQHPAIEPLHPRELEGTARLREDSGVESAHQQLGPVRAHEGVPTQQEDPLPGRHPQTANRDDQLGEARVGGEELATREQPPGMAKASRVEDHRRPTATQREALQLRGRGLAHGQSLAANCGEGPPVRGRHA